MCRKLICLVSFTLVLGLVLTSVTKADDPDLVGWWKLDDGSGTTAIDSSGNGNHGALINSPEWQTAGDDVKVGSSALEFDFPTDGSTTSSDYVDCGDKPEFDITDNITLALWVKSDGFRQRYQYFFSKDTGGGGYSIIRNAETRNCRVVFNGLSGQYYATGSTIIDDGQWHHLAASYDSSTGAVAFYTDGLLEVSETASGSIPTNDLSLHIGGRDVRNCNAIIDDVRIYNRTLSLEQIQVVMAGGGAGFPLAMRPDPEDGAMLEAAWVNLSWRPGSFAVSHDVYIGDNFNDVNAGAEGTFQGNQNTTLLTAGFPGFPLPGGLVPGTTYYWRIDEVNDAEPNSPWKGDIWSFMIPPKTAYLPDPADGAESVDTDVTLTWTGGFGSKLHTVYFGNNFDDVSNAAGGLPQGSATHTPGPLEFAKTYYWRVDEFDAVDTFKGEVWSFLTQGAVGSPDPAKGAVDVTQTPVLTWVSGVFADTHEVYFGTDASSLELKGSGNLGSESYDAGDLEWNTTYYWRIDEANNANADSPWTGPLWSFTTANFLVVDDFESYNDLDPTDPASNRIFNAWLDGFGDPTNGSLVGYENPPFAEQTIVHGGAQSMPMFYDNAAGKSEATLTLTSNRDWTVNGVNRLTIWYRGTSSNATEQMYVVLNGSAAVNHDNPDAAQAAGWNEWNIDLQAFADQGLNLTNVTSITIGLGNRANPVAGGVGIMYFDDIRLYALESEAP